MRFSRALLSRFRVSLASLESRPSGIASGRQIGEQIEKLVFVEAIDQCRWHQRHWGGLDRRDPVFSYFVEQIRQERVGRDHVGLLVLLHDATDDHIAVLEIQKLGVVLVGDNFARLNDCLLYTSPSPRDRQKSRMPSSA